MVCTPFLISTSSFISFSSVLQSTRLPLLPLSSPPRPCMSPYLYRVSRSLFFHFTSSYSIANIVIFLFSCFISFVPCHACHSAWFGNFIFPPQAPTCFHIKLHPPLFLSLNLLLLFGRRFFSSFSSWCHLFPSFFSVHVFLSLQLASFSLLCGSSASSLLKHSALFTSLYPLIVFFTSLEPFFKSFATHFPSTISQNPPPWMSFLVCLPLSVLIWSPYQRLSQFTSLNDLLNPFTHLSSLFTFFPTFLSILLIFRDFRHPLHFNISLPLLPLCLFLLSISLRSYLSTSFFKIHHCQLPS